MIRPYIYPGLTETGMTDKRISRPGPAQFALFNLGFRPFYLLAGLLAAVAVPVWLAAAAVRVFGGLFWPAGYAATLLASGILWSVAFLVFLVAYWPILTRPRVDGRPG
jgi:uncharacterized protein involved in response to NO